MEEGGWDRQQCLVGRFDVLRAQANRPRPSTNGPRHVVRRQRADQRGIEALLSAEARDEVSANNLRDGFAARPAKLQTSAKPSISGLSIAAAQWNGQTVACPWTPAQVFDALRAAMPSPAREGIK
jgi:hypothetical protein